MPPELVHPITRDEVTEWVRTMAVTFLHDPDSPGSERWTARAREQWGDGDRAWGVRDGGRWVATLRTEPRRLALPAAGGATRDTVADALTNVTVAATHRRRGLMSQMLDASLRAARDRGDAVSILVAAEWGIYDRFGYAPSVPGADYVLYPTRPRATVVAADPARLRQVERDELGAIAPDLYERARRQRVGQIDRPDPWWRFHLALDGRGVDDDEPRAFVVHDGDDGPDGLLTWRTVTSGESLLPPHGTIEVSDLVALDRRAYADLWGYLCGVDLVDEVRLPDRPVDEAAPWLLGNGRALVRTAQVDHVWLKLLDVPAALAARRYAVAGELVLEVADDSVAAPAGGRFVLRADGDAVECEPTRADPDLALDVRALAAAYLGGYRLSELALAGRAQELTAGSVARAELMLSTPRAPWNATGF